MTKINKLVKKVTNLWKKVTKRQKLAKTCYKKWQATEKIHRIVNLNSQISKVVTKTKYLDQDAGDGLWPNHYYCVETHQSAAQFDYVLHEIGNRNWRCWWTWTPLSGT